MKKQSKTKRTGPAQVGELTDLTAAYVLLLTLPECLLPEDAMASAEKFELRCGPEAAAKCLDEALWIAMHGGALNLDDGLVLNVCLADSNKPTLSLLRTES